MKIFNETYRSKDEKQTVKKENVCDISVSTESSSAILFSSHDMPPLYCLHS